ncbi:hypothetical protein M3175_09610 [Robertmurraya korlensis]|uniref:hypothetical protein n=1 Tax=Robertmurraya korlensis TaxID=519977 RepID=UPI00203E4834|nr:hypothetical protein [Robertmurraya korlensis]MCM3600987.1 hypothetical protein [Robertmurraya korlensis]
MVSITMVIFVFFVCFLISSVLNLLFKKTEKRDWLITFLISVGFSVIIVPLLAG